MIETFQYSNQQQWLDALTRDFHEIIAEAIAARDRAHVGLSGGSTPRAFYQRLNQEPIPWGKIEWWLGDERWVPPTDEASNEKMLRETLGKNRPEFDAHFCSWHPAPGPEEAARVYQTKLRKQIGDPPLFDLVLLGIGPDGHMASLFPGTIALKEAKMFAMANPVPQLKTTRLTMTFPLFNQARRIRFLVQGKDDMVKKFMEQDDNIPAARIQNLSQRLYWLH